MSTAILAVVGVFFAGMGVYALALPSALARPFNLVVDSAESRSEVRAVYGGFGLAIAGVLWWAASGSSGLHTGVAVTVSAAMAGMAGGRILSRLIDSSVAFYPIWFYCLVEVFGAAVLLHAA